MGSSLSRIQAIIYDRDFPRFPRPAQCRTNHQMTYSLKDFIYDTGYPHDGRADKNSYPHDGCADKDSYPHDCRADNAPYPHDRNMRFSSKLNNALFSILIVSFF